jgi:hypothetical protein
LSPDTAASPFADEATAVTVKAVSTSAGGSGWITRAAPFDSPTVLPSVI